MTPRPYATKIETTIKQGAENVLGQRTLIIGPNRSGKSTLVNALEAAGSGRVSDVAGRTTLAKDSELITLADGDSVWARASFSDGTISEWRLEKNHRAKRTGPEIAFPLREVREAILGEPDKTRRWILRHGGLLLWGEVVDMVPKSLRKRLGGLVGEADMGEGAPEALASAIQKAGERKRAAAGTAKLARETAKGASAFGTPPSEAEIAEAEKAVSRAGNPEGKAEAGRIRAAIAAQEARKKQLEASLSAFPDLPVSPIVTAALEVAEALVKSKATACAICGNAVNHTAMAERAARGRARLDAAIKSSAEREKASASLRAVEQELAISRATLSGLRASDGDGSDPVAARSHLSDLMRRRAGWEAARNAEDEALQAEQEATAWSQVADSLSSALGSLVEKARLGFEAKVQALLPQGWVFGIELKDGEREVTRIGLREGPHLRTALSGAEWATVTAALALATTGDAPGPVMVCPEERAFDPTTLSSVLLAFDRVSEAQVVITSPVEPKAVPAGWTVIRTGAETLFYAPVGEKLAPVAREAGKKIEGEIKAIEGEFNLFGE